MIRAAVEVDADGKSDDCVFRVCTPEAMALDDAVEGFMNLMGDEMEDTLIIVTSDHGHTMSFGSIASRGSDIMGKV